MMSEPAPPLYRVDRLPIVLAAIRSLGKRAVRLGVRQVFIESLKRIINDLGATPLQWGDPEYHTVHEGGTVFHGIRFPLFVRYAVYEAERIVVIIEVTALPGSRLDTD
jgi:hypothetical protein